MVRIFILFPHARAKFFEDHFLSVGIKGKKAYTVAPFPNAGRYGVVSDLFSCFYRTHHCTLLPHSEQNFAPAGSGLPQFGQNAAFETIFSPHDRQNLDPAGTDAPQFGHTACPAADGVFG
jgi:hypothetical protein